MRITGGQLAGRIFVPPADHWPTRPTTDIAREALFNILSNFLDYEHIRMLDLFGGSGAHSYEMASRGCADIVYVDKFGPCIKFVNNMVKEFKLENSITLIQSDYERFIKSKPKPFGYIFAGPPYNLTSLGRIPELILSSNCLLPDGLFILEHNPDHSFLDHTCFWQVRKYGQTNFSFFKP